MLKRIGLIGMVVLLTLTLAWNPLFSKKGKGLKKICCIAGNYEGFHEDLPSFTCTDPGSDPFKMVIYQEKGCKSNIWGKIVGSDGEPMEFKGTVAPATKGCCKIHGVAKKPGESVEFKAILCKKSGKWYTEDGKYKHSNGCTGTFKLKQV